MGFNIFHPCYLCSEENCEDDGMCKWRGGRCQGPAKPPSTSSPPTSPTWSKRTAQSKGKKYLIIKT